MFHLDYEGIDFGKRRMGNCRMERRNLHGRRLGRRGRRMGCCPQRLPLWKEWGMLEGMCVVNSDSIQSSIQQGIQHLGVSNFGVCKVVDRLKESGIRCSLSLRASIALIGFTS